MSEHTQKFLVIYSGVLTLALGAIVLTGATGTGKARFTEIDVERINIVTADGQREMVLSNRSRLPMALVDGREIGGHRDKPGIIFYNAVGDENGGLIFDGKLDEQGRPVAGMHFSMDRFGGDQQLALGHYESNGTMESGLNIYDRGLEREYGPLYQALAEATDEAEKVQLRQRWIEAGGRQTKRLFVGKTRGQSSAVILADAAGRPRIMMLVEPDGNPVLNFLDERGEVVQSLPAGNTSAQ